MAYSSGLMNTRVKVFYPVRTETRGGACTRFRKGSIFWCGVTWVKGARALRNGNVDAYESILVRMRWHGDDAINRYCRLLINDKYYIIDSMNADKHSNTIQITATEVQAFEVEKDIANNG